MESSKMYYHSWCRYRTYHCVAAKYPVSWGQYRAQNRNMRNFGPTNPNGTAFVLKQWLYQKEATGMESSKMYCPSRCRYRTYHCVEAKYPVSRGGSIGPRMEICETSVLPIPMVQRLHQNNGYIKRKLRAWRVQKCITIVGADIVLITAWPQSTSFHGGSIGPRMEICETSTLPILMVPRLY